MRKLGLEEDSNHCSSTSLTEGRQGPSLARFRVAISCLLLHDNTVPWQTTPYDWNCEAQEVVLELDLVVDDNRVQVCRI